MKNSCTPRAFVLALSLAALAAPATQVLAHTSHPHGGAPKEAPKQTAPEQAAPKPGTPKEEVVACTVTGEEVPKGEALTSVYEGKTYYFCCGGCKRSFDKDPAKYAKAFNDKKSKPTVKQPAKNKAA